MKHRNFKLLETTYQNNLDSDYTEKITELSKGCLYDQNRDYFWCEPSYSLLYGTPLYDEASEAQRLALNHLGWITLYYGIAQSEMEAVTYNQITAGVFEALSGFGTLAQEVLMETEQERHHIKAFKKVGLMTEVALMGPHRLGSLTSKSTADQPSLPTSSYYVARGTAKRLTNPRYKPYYSSFLVD